MVTTSHPGRKFSWASFAVATAIAIVAVSALIILGRVSYARTDFFPLPPTSDSPGVTTLPPDTFIGSPNALVTIVVYSDFQCGPCQAFALITEKELERNYIEAGKVRIVYKHLIEGGEESMLAAQAAECAAEQNKFWPYHDLLMQIRASSTVSDLSVAKLESLAQQLGLNIETFDDSLMSGKFKEKVLHDDAEARALGVTGTPTFFINRMKGTGYKPFEAFQKVIEELLHRSVN